MTRKTIAVPFIILGALNLTAVLYITAQHPTPKGGDWLLVLMPVTGSLVCLIFSLLLYFSHLENSPVWAKSLWGFFLGANAFLLLQTLVIAMQFDAIASDGTMYWASLSLPPLWIGLPLFIVGGIVGTIVGVKKKPKGETIA